MSVTPHWPHASHPDNADDANDAAPADAATRPEPADATDPPRLQAALTWILSRRHEHVGRVRQWQRWCEPELAYGRHHGQPPATARDAAVLILLYPKGGDWHVPLTRRSDALPDHPGQVSCPGGVVEAGESRRDAALREWEEEMGGSAANFALVGELSPLHVFVSNFRVTPWVAVAASAPTFRPNPAEVAKIVELPVRELRQRAAPAHAWPRHEIHRAGLRWRAPHLPCQGEQIWGATLQLLVELACYLDLLIDVERH